MKLNYWRLGAKGFIALLLVTGMLVFERLIHPVASAASAVGQLADSYDSSAQLTAYTWLLPVLWVVVGLVIIVLIVTEVRALVAQAMKEGPKS